MRFWTREIAGWLLLIIGLFIFARCYAILTDAVPHILEGGSLTLIGIIIFRGGLHLLKVAVAARICLMAQELTSRND
jgi:hypothetical protein